MVWIYLVIAHEHLILTHWNPVVNKGFYSFVPVLQIYYQRIIYMKRNPFLHEKKSFSSWKEIIFIVKIIRCRYLLGSLFSVQRYVLSLIYVCSQQLFYSFSIRIFVLKCLSLPRINIYEKDEEDIIFTFSGSDCSQCTGTDADRYAASWGVVGNG